MNLKAILVCDDVRVEMGGTLTLVGVYNDRLIASPGDGPIELPRLAFLAVVGGLKGISQVGFRQRIRGVDEPVGELAPLEAQTHNPEAGEHNFVFGQAPMVFPGPGTYELVIDLDSGSRQATYRYRFYLERAVADA